ncbi:MAG TPA: CBS domain-containing protein [Polyangia bacterium]
MTPIPQCCTPDDSIIEVARVMEQHDVGVVPIVESQDTRRVVGVITDRDIVLRIVAQGRDPNEIVSLRDFMTNEIVSVRPEADILHAEECMKEHQIRRVLVVDENNCIVGIVTMADLARATGDTQLGDTEKAITHR